MKKTVLVALIMVFAASAVQAAWFSDDFESYAVPPQLRLRLAAPNWEGGAGPENYINDSAAYPGLTTGKAVRLKGSSGSGANSDATTTGDLSPLSTGSVQILTFTLQSELTQQSPGYNHLYVRMLSSTGVDMGYWYGHSGAIIPRHPGAAGSAYAVNIADGAVHTFGIKYDPATGVTEWLHNGNVQWTQTLATGRAVKEIYVQDQHRVDDVTLAPINDWVYLDNVMVTPEPAALVLLLLGSLACTRRRRA